MKLYLEEGSCESYATCLVFDAHCFVEGVHGPHGDTDIDVVDRELGGEHGADGAAAALICTIAEGLVRDAGLFAEELDACRTSRVGCIGSDCILDRDTAVDNRALGRICDFTVMGVDSVSRIR